MEGCRLAVNDLACRRGDRVLFRGLSFELNASEALQVVGPNGTGKSSLLRIVAGLLRPFAGKVDREGSLGLVDERPALDEHLPLGRALAFWGRIDSAGFISWESASDRLGVTGVLDVPVQYLSTGQRKRAALTRLLSQQAAVWLLDEPLNGLDAATARECERLVADHCRAGGIALIASHQPFALPSMKKLAIADFSPPVQGRGRGWGMPDDAAFADSPHPNPSPEGEGL
jgi:heme exporter protein A